MSDDPRGNICRLEVYAGSAALDAIKWGHMAWFVNNADDRKRAIERFREAVAKFNRAVAEFDAPPDEPEPDEPEEPVEFPDGCTCKTPIAGPTDIDPPERKTDPWCPTHGWRDADDERDRRIDEKLMGYDE